jgi:hypothetical protein
MFILSFFLRINNGFAFISAVLQVLGKLSASNIESCIFPSPLVSEAGIVMSVSIKNFNRPNSGNTRSSGGKAKAALPSIRDVFPAGKSAARTSSSTPAAKTSSSDYIASPAFMRNLKAKLSLAGDDPAQYLRARAMVGALERGALQVTNPTQGKTINAWDPNQKKATPTTATDTAKTNWVDFLNTQLKRSEDGALSKDGNGSYVEKATGKNAYFGRVAGKYYYVTWPAETKA